jgi:hypothetical protein
MSERGKKPPLYLIQRVAMCTSMVNFRSWSVDGGAFVGGRLGNPTLAYGSASELSFP